MQLDFSFREEPEKTPEPAEESPRVLSVTELTRRVRALLERGLGEVWVRGEISNYRRQASGHHYFTLKDDGCQLACVLFASAARSLRGLRLADGMQVQAFGALTVYEARGQYQLIVELVQEEGLGALQARFEALKAKLAAEGLFDAERKRPLPRLPLRIGVVTSPTGAAIRDFLKVLHRRMPGVEVIVNPARVQGRGAAAEIAAAVTEFSFAPENGLPVVDVVVVTRGGGSLEDLWEFNEEAVARAIAASRIPVVSAVGHEIDFTLSDFAADFRAPTPSAAAELLVPDAVELRRAVERHALRLLRECTGAIRFHRSRLIALERSALFREPARILRERGQSLDLLAESLRRAAVQAVDARAAQLRHARAVIAAHRPAPLLALCRERAARAHVLLGECAARQLGRRRERLAASAALLGTLSPEATLARGYSITRDASGRIVRSAAELAPGDALRTRFRDGEAESVVR
jgi:exodeoxyribonuclease VII large subunit